MSSVMISGSGWKPALWVMWGNATAFAYGLRQCPTADWKPVPLLSNEEWAMSSEQWVVSNDCWLLIILVLASSQLIGYRLSGDFVPGYWKCWLPARTFAHRHRYRFQKSCLCLSVLFFPRETIWNHLKLETWNQRQRLKLSETLWICGFNIIVTCNSYKNVRLYLLQNGWVNLNRIS